MGAKQVLAFDFGASSGRAMLASLENGAIRLKEIHRFSNDPVSVNGTLYWDILRLFHEIKQGILKAKQEGGFQSIGIDTWGVDFGLLDAQGKLLENPVHYRDGRTDHIMEEVYRVIGPRELYRRTGNQLLAINSLFQLAALKAQRPQLLKQAKSLLFIPDLLAYFLTGEQHSEYTIASTSQMLNARTRDWDREILEQLGIPAEILREVIQPASIHGTLTKELCEELGVPPVPVIAVAQHDTASAVAAVPTDQKDFIYISCGTWSLFGTELQEPMINEESAAANLTNEGGFGGTIRYLKNIMGLWLIQESRRQWIREGQQVSYADLEREALACESFVSFIDPDAPEFVKPGDMPGRIREFCKKTGQRVPESRGEVMRCVYESLAMKYRYVFQQISKTTHRQFPVIHVVGGGTKDGLLCRLTAASCGVPVVAGPIEATVCGNVAVQLCALGELGSLQDIRRVIQASECPKTYMPEQPQGWDEAYQRFCAIVGK